MLFHASRIRTPVKSLFTMDTAFLFKIKVKLALVYYVRTNLDIGGCHHNQNNQPNGPI